MIEVVAWHHCYGNVEAERSPKGRRGFQTLAYSKDDLTDEDVEEIEARVFVPPERCRTAFMKWLFFSLPSGKYVCTRVVPEKQQLDEIGRGGRSFAHSIVLALSEFKKLSCNPFPIFRQAEFRSSADETISSIETQGVSNKLKVVSPAKSAVSKKLQGDSFRELAMLAVSSRELASKRQSIELVGNSDLVMDRLELVFSAVPEEIRRELSFDSLFFRETSATGIHFWAIGTESHWETDRVIQLGSSKEKAEQIIAVAAERPFNRWFQAVAQNDNWQTIIEQKELISELSNSLKTADDLSGTLEGVPGSVLEHFCSVNEGFVRDHISRRFSTLASEAIVQPLVEKFCGSKNVRDLSKALRKKVTIDLIADELARYHFAQLPAVPSPTQRAGLSELADKTKLPLLLALSALWSSDIPGLRRHLSQMSDKDYEVFVERILRSGSIRASDIIESSKTASLVRVVEESPLLDTSEMCALMIRLSELRQFALIDSMSHHLEEFKERELHKLRKALTPFVADLNEVVAAIDSRVFQIQQERKERVHALFPLKTLAEYGHRVWRRLRRSDK